MGAGAVEILGRPVYCPPEMQNVSARQPAGRQSEQVVGRLWQSDSNLIERFLQYLVRNRKTRVAQQVKREGSAWLPVYFRRYRALGGE